MKLVPCARVSVIRSEKMNLRIPKMKFCSISGCIYNQKGDYKISSGGTSEVQVIKSQVKLKE